MATLHACRRFEAIQNRRLEIGGRKLILSSDHHAERDGYLARLPSLRDSKIDVKEA